MMPSCLDCRREMRVEKNDQRVIEHTEDHKPYKIWSGDTWECPECHIRVVVNYGSTPVSEHFKPEFARVSRGAVAIYSAFGHPTTGDAT